MRDEILELLLCPACRERLHHLPESFRCDQCNQTYAVEKGVVRFLGEEDSFYEGAYQRQIHYVPGRNPLKNWGFFHLVQSGVLGELKQEIRRKNATVLDVGCAGGICWLGRDALTVGVDVSLSSLALVATTYGAALQASALTLPVREGVFDVAYGSYFFEHLTKEEKRRCLREFARVLKDGGSVVLQFDTLSSNALTRYAQHDPDAYKRGFIDHDGHVGLAPLTETLSLFEEEGFRVSRTIKFGTTFIQYLPTYGWLNIAYGDRVRWVRWLARFAKGLSSFRLNMAYEFAVTSFDRLINPLTNPDKATRAIVVARKDV